MIMLIDWKLILSVLVIFDQWYIAMNSNRNKVQQETSSAQEIQQNITSISIDGWKLTAWTSAVVYTPDEPIDIRLQLVFEGEQKNSKLSAQVHIFLTQANNKQIIRETQWQALSPDTYRIPSGWELIILDVFKTDTRYPGSSTLKLGEYLINVNTLIEDETSLEVNEIPIKVLVSEE